MKSDKLGLSIVRIFGILAALILVGLTMVTWELYHFDRPTVLLVGVAMLVAGGLAWMYAIKCKQATRNVRTARRLECLCLFFLVADLLFALFYAPPALRVVTHQAALSEAAAADCDAVWESVERFTTEQIVNRIDVTEQGLSAFLVARPEHVSPELESYIRHTVMHNSPGQLSQQTLRRFIDDSKTLARRGAMTGDPFYEFQVAARDVAAQVDDRVYREYSFIGHEFDVLNYDLKQLMDSMALKLNMCSVTLDRANGTYTCEPIPSPRYSDDEIVSEFEAAWYDASGYHAAECLICLLLALLVLADFLTTRRAVLPPSRGPRISDSHSLPL